MVHLPPNDLLVCPQCGADCHSGLCVQEQYCSTCEQYFFDLAGMPCWFAEGVAHKQRWQSQLALWIQQTTKALEQTHLPPALLPAIKERLHREKAFNQKLISSIETLAKDIDLEPKIFLDYTKVDSSRLLQYYQLFLRDWAWQETSGWALDQESETVREFKRIAAALKPVNKPLGRVLVLGAGAGRLSVDIHHHLKPELTVAFDINPLLLGSAHRLIQQHKSWSIPEIFPHPQIGYHSVAEWPMAEKAPNNPEAWYAMIGDAWQAPFKAHSFDTVITPWFLDVNGRGITESIGLVQHLLKPKGVWINSGPLLYSQDRPPHERYNHDEVVQLLALARFDLQHQAHTTSAYMQSPLADEHRVDQVWTFSAIAPESMASPKHAENAENTPAWLVLPHINIPLDQTLNDHGNPVLKQLVTLVDGERSINDIAAIMQPNLGPDKEAKEVVLRAFIDYLLVP